jgi:hypothetical protein
MWKTKIKESYRIWIWMLLSFHQDHKPFIQLRVQVKIPKKQPKNPINPKAWKKTLIFLKNQALSKLNRIRKFLQCHFHFKTKTLEEKRLINNIHTKHQFSQNLTPQMRYLCTLATLRTMFKPLANINTLNLSFRHIRITRMITDWWSRWICHNKTNKNSTPNLCGTCQIKRSKLKFQKGKILRGGLMTSIISLVKAILKMGSIKIINKCLYLINIKCLKSKLNTNQMWLTFIIIKLRKGKTSILLRAFSTSKSKFNNKMKI